ncbi:hypothetical protein [Galactobacillus timonensis]|uniref:hypothetical protein n=1 Tax=Galactobacillus timonensis TaxID=2041840 RepID=UPI000C85847B|nr:hypothetical protein [Galactobacillus timonensis]
MKTDELARRLDQFAYDFDPYGYMDSMDDREAGFEQIKADLLQGDAKGIQSFLHEAIEDMEPDDELFGEASSLLNELESYERSDRRASVLDSIRQAEGMSSIRTADNNKMALEPER